MMLDDYLASQIYRVMIPFSSLLHYFAIKKKLVLICLDFPGMSKGKKYQNRKIVLQKGIKTREKSPLA
jgi:hypothetical protein